MRILLLTTLYPGYAEQSKIQATHVIHYFAKEWIKRNEVKVIRLWPYYPNIFRCFKKARMLNQYSYEEKFILDGVSIFRIPILKLPKINYKTKDKARYPKKIIEQIGKVDKPDVIICDILNPSIYIGEIIAREFNSLLVASLHNTDLFYLANKKNYKKFMKTDPNINLIVFRSKRIEENFFRLYKGNRSKKAFTTILFGVDKKDIIDEKKLEIKIKNPSKVIMIAASLKKLKKIDILIEAFAKVENKNGYVLKIIGDGSERNRLEKQVKDLGCADYVSFEGEKTRSEVLDLMEQAEIFAMVSSPETFGLVYIEAMAKGCITIGSKGEGIDGVIIDNENGFLCVPNDTEALKLALEKGINLNIEEKKRIINNAIKTAYSLNYEDLSKRYLEEIKELMLNNNFN